MPIARAPWIIVAAAAMQTLVEADLATELAEILLELAQLRDPAAIAPLPLKLRWLRNRYTTNEEKPCLALAFVQDGPASPDDPEAAGVLYRELHLDLIIDLERPTEVQADEEAMIADMGGIEILAHFERRGIQAFKAGFIDQAGAPTALSAVATWVTEIGVDNDEDMVDIEGRLASRFIVQYRVRSEDPMVLLYPGG